MKKIITGMLLGAALTVSGLTGYEAHRYATTSAPPSTVAVAKPLLGFTVAPEWVKSGTPNFRNVETLRSPDGKTISGLWGCDGPSTFEWTFHMDETVHLLEGLVEIEYLGNRFTLRPGDTATFHAGSKAVWHVPQSVKKAYTLHHPGRLALLWRRMIQT